MTYSQAFQKLFELSTEGKDPARQVNVLIEFDKIMAELDDERELERANDIFEGLMIHVDPTSKEYEHYLLSGKA